MRLEKNVAYLIFTTGGSVSGSQGAYRGASTAHRGVEVSRHHQWCDRCEAQVTVLLVLHHTLQCKPATEQHQTAQIGKPPEINE